MAFRQRGGTRAARALACRLGLVASLLATTPALAQSPMERETARQLMHDGYALQAKGDTTGALDAFRRAHAIMNVPTTGLEVGRTLVALGKIVEARDVLWRVARMKESPDDPPVYRAARDDARELTESLAPRLASLRILPRGAGYTVAIDGTELSPALIGVATKVDPGEHVVTAQRDGRRVELRVSVAENETKDVPIAIDARAPGSLAPPPAQPHNDPAPPHRVSSLVWVGFIGAGAYMVAGGITGGLAIARKSEASSHCEGDRCLPAAKDALDSSRTFATISTATFITGGALALVSGIFYFIEKGRAPSPRATAAVRPFVAHDHAGVFGSF
ncbi:hypothetical protein [Pendulispora albinea]|uniref:Tetratricopeptide repeat protein n=1 Tax=Pendulispora albinea TaxID=2741071 RepID=A0ABZ2M236_9BACT